MSTADSALVNGCSARAFGGGWLRLVAVMVVVGAAGGCARSSSDAPSSSSLTVASSPVVTEVSVSPVTPSGTSLALATCESPGSTSATECEGMWLLYESMGASAWAQDRPWGNGVDPCAWWGAECVGGRVVSVVLDLSTDSGDGLAGTAIGLDRLLFLERLVLIGNGDAIGLTEVPESASGLVRLRELRLRGNRISSLPAWVPSLPGLETLDVGDNRLTELPDSFPAESALTELSVDSNQLESLPGSLVGASRLRVLNASNNALVEVPAWVGDLRRLEYLRLDGNRVAGVPDTTFAAVSLLVLDLRGNVVQEIGAGIGDLGSLTVLDISDNLLTQLPDEVGELAELETLALGHNRLSELPAAIGNLSQLVVLGLEGNQLTSLPLELTALGSLRELTLSDNSIGGDITAFVAYLRSQHEMLGMKLDLANMGCPSVTSADDADWLDTITPAWRAGCSQ